MSATALLTQLHAAGFTVARHGERLWITPSSRLTDDLRAELQVHKTELLALLPDTGLPLGCEKPDQPDHSDLDGGLLDGTDGGANRHDPPSVPARETPIATESGPSRPPHDLERAASGRGPDSGEGAGGARGAAAEAADAAQDDVAPPDPLWRTAALAPHEVAALLKALDPTPDAPRGRCIHCLRAPVPPHRVWACERCASMNAARLGIVDPLALPSTPALPPGCRWCPTCPPGTWRAIGAKYERCSVCTAIWRLPEVPPAGPLPD